MTGQGGQGGRDEASLNEGWDEMQLRSRLMKYHPTPPVELVLSIVTDNEPIPSKAYKHLGFLLFIQSGHHLILIECYQ